jgi:hypothetical protein
MLARAEKLNEANEELTKFSAAVLTIYVQSFVECLQACRDVGSFIGTVSKHASGGPLSVVKLLCYVVNIGTTSASIGALYRLCLEVSKIWLSTLH